MTDSAKLQLDSQTFELPIRVGSEGTRSIDITRLFKSYPAHSVCRPERHTACAGYMGR